MMFSLWFLLALAAAVSGCSDKTSYCKTWASTGYCDPSHKYFSYMSTNCLKSCNFCNLPPSLPPSLPPPGCVDKLSYCSTYKDYCTHPDYLDYVQKECKLTCNYCHITTTPPPTTKPTKPYTGAAGRGLQANCGRKGPGHTRIVGGTNSKPGDWPWQVNIDYEFNMGNPGSHCGGTLLNDEWVLTAAHCFNDAVKSRYWVKLGEHNLKTHSKWEQFFNVSQMILHPKYDPAKNHDYDFALLKLSRKVIFNDRVRPACLPEHTTDFPTGTECYISGWGLLKEYGSGPAILQQAKVPLTDKPVCQRAFDNFGHKLTSRMICAGYGNRAIDSCQGDSGGPLVCKRKDPATNEDVWYSWGVISWGVGCARNGMYGVYASTKAAQEWASKIAFGVADPLKE